MTAQNDAPVTPRDGAPPFAFPTAHHPEEAEKVRARPHAQPGEDQLDDAISQSFPASDPVSVTVSPVPKDETEKKKDGAAAAVAAPASALWAVALVSTAALGVGAALLWGRRRKAAQQPRALLAEGLRGAWAQAGRQVQKARKQGQQEQQRVQRLLHSLHR